MSEQPDNPTSKNRKTLSALLGNFAGLTDEQYLTARNAGYSSQELTGTTWHWYQLHHATMTTDRKNKNAPALQKQIDFLESLGYSIEQYQKYYNVLRAAICAYILNVEDDARFRRAYEANQKDNNERKYRSRNRPTGDATGRDAQS